MKRRVWSIILCLFLMMTLLPVAAFADDPDTYDLTLSMQVTGNYGFHDKYFSLDVTIEGGDREALHTVDLTNASADDGNGHVNPTSFRQGLYTTLTLYLKHGESITICDLESATEYFISEYAEDYTPSYVLDGGAKVRGGSIGDPFNHLKMNGADHSVVFTNHRSGTAPAITTHPENQTATEGDTATFSVVAIGNPAPGYQWQVSTDSGGSWSNVTNGTGGTSTSYTTPATTVAMNGYQYRCIASNGISPDATSSAAILTVTAPAPPTLTVTPTSSFPQSSAGNPPNCAAHFDRVEIGGSGVPFTAIDPANYVLTYGSIHIALNQNYLNTLAIGTYTLHIYLAGAFAGAPLTTTLTVTAPGSGGVPKTGDGSTPGLWLGIMLMAWAVLTASLVMRRKRKNGFDC